MQLYPSESNPPAHAELVCRQSRLIALSVVVLYVGLLVVLPVTLSCVDKIPPWLAATLVAIATAVFPIVGGSFFATLRNSNWTFASGPDGLWVNLRSYTNYRLAEGPTVVYFSYDELTSAARHVEHRSAPTGDGTMTWTEVALDLRLRSRNAGQLRQAIAEERDRRSVRKVLGGCITISGRAQHVPVTMPQDDLLRVTWKSRYDFVSPGLNRVLDRLSTYVQVLEEQCSNTSGDWRELSAAEIDAQILQFVEAGDHLSAIKMLRLCHGYTIAEAKQFVDGLTGRLALPADALRTTDSQLSG